MISPLFNNHLFCQHLVTYSLTERHFVSIVFCLLLLFYYFPEGLYRLSEGNPQIVISVIQREFQNVTLHKFIFKSIYYIRMMVYY